MTNLVTKRPKHYTGSDELAIGSVRDFTSLEELRKSREEVLEAEFIGKIIQKELVGKVEEIFKVIDYPQDLRFTGIFLTAFVNFCISNKASFKPVKRDELWELIQKDEVDQKMNGFKKEFLSKIGALTGEENKYLDDFIYASKQRFLDEFKEMDNLPESHYIHSVWVN
jgi:hypothetical protein